MLATSGASPNDANAGAGSNPRPATPAPRLRNSRRCMTTPHGGTIPPRSLDPPDISSSSACQSRGGAPVAGAIGHPGPGASCSPVVLVRIGRRPRERGPASLRGRRRAPPSGPVGLLQLRRGSWAGLRPRPHRARPAVRLARCAVIFDPPASRPRNFTAPGGMKKRGEARNPLSPMSGDTRAGRMQIWRLEIPGHLTSPPAAQRQRKSRPHPPRCRPRTQ